MFLRQAATIISQRSISVGEFPRRAKGQNFLLVSKRYLTSQQHGVPKRSKKLLITAALVGAGSSLVVYSAKHNDSFRAWTQQYFPALDKLVEILYQGKDGFFDYIQKYLGEDTRRLERIVVSEGTKLQFLDNIPKGPDKGRTNSKDYPPNIAVPNELQHLKLLEDKLVKDCQKAMEDCNAAVKALKEKTDALENIDMLINCQDPEQWNQFQKRIEDGQRFKERFYEGVEQVKTTVENLQRQMNLTPGLKSDMRQKIDDSIQNSLATIKKAEKSLNAQITKSNLVYKSSNKVKMARMYFSDLLETEKLPSFIKHILDTTLFAAKDLHKIQTILEPQITTEAEVTKEGDSISSLNTLTELFVSIETAKDKRLRQQKIQKLSLEENFNLQKNCRESLKKLTELYTDLKKEMLAITQREMEHEMMYLYAERLQELQTHYKEEVTKLAALGKGYIEALNKRDEVQKSFYDKQRFWSAAERLVSAVKSIDRYDENEQKPLKNEILNLLKTTPESDEFVENVLQTIPGQAVEHGVVSLVSLKQRFLTVEKQARHVAGLPKGQVSLLQLGLARLQSALYSDQPISEAELNNEAIDIASLNNYNCLQRARYYVDREELDQAIMYLNLLEGPSETVASGWVKDAVVYLETVQAAELLMAHASLISQYT